MDEFSRYLPGILMSYSAFLLAVATPGPNVLAIMSASMSQGRRSGIALGLGVAAGSFSWALLTGFGLTALMMTYASVLTGLKFAGGIYLLWLAYKSFRAALSGTGMAVPSAIKETRSDIAFMKSGYLIMMTNPKAILGWVAIVSLGMQEGAPWWVGAVIVGGTTALSLILHVTYAIVFSTSVMQRSYARASRSLQILFGGFFTLAGLRLLSAP